MRVIQELPMLFSISSKGKAKQWNIKVVEENGSVYVESSHGYVGHTIVTARSSAKAGKNIGRKNATTPEQQAIKEAQSKWNGKKDENYLEELPDDISKFLNKLPMLAHSFWSKRHLIKYPCYLQPKLNGIRCLAIDNMGHRQNGPRISMTSRGGKEFEHMGHIVEAILNADMDLQDLHEDLFLYGLDGELFNPKMTFQEITRAVKAERDSNTDIQYWIYDIPDTTIPFKERITLMDELGSVLFEETSCLRIVPTYEIQNEEELFEMHKKLSIDYEGSIIRNADGMYIFDFRSSDLLKLKDFVDAEFLIVGGKSATGADEGTVVFQCVTSEGKHFNVRPEGEREYRRDLFDDLAGIIERKSLLTVRYQDLSEDGIPIFPVGIAIRDYE
jgi:DNA ligase-1